MIFIIAIYNYLSIYNKNLLNKPKILSPAHYLIQLNIKHYINNRIPHLRRAKEALEFWEPQALHRLQHNLQLL